MSLHQHSILAQKYHLANSRFPNFNLNLSFMPFELSHFDGYFHIFAAVNVAYAVSEDFRGIVIKGITSISFINPARIDLKIESIRTKMKTPFGTLQDEKFEKKVQGKLDTLQRKYRKKISDFEAMKNENKKIIEFKSLYLFSGLFSFAMLLIGGFQQFFSDENKVKNVLFAFCITGFIFIILTILLAFISKRERIIPLFFTFIFCVIFFYVSVIYGLRCPLANDITNNMIEMSSVMWCAVFLPVSPYIIQMIKELLIYIRYFGESYRIENEIQKDLLELQSHVDFINIDDGI